MSGDSTSRSLLARVRSHDSEAWDHLVSLYAPLVLHWLRASLDEDDVSDVFQDVFQAAASHIDGFRKERKSDTFRGWLRTISRNKVNDHFRRRKKEPRGVGGSAILASLEQLPQPDATGDPPSPKSPYPALLHRVLENTKTHFQPKTWAAFQRTVLDGVAPCDVATELSMSPGAVRVAKSRVLQRLRAELGDLTPEDL